MKDRIKILAIGDIVGRESVEKVCRAVNGIRNQNDIDFTVANGENAADGNGLDQSTAETLLGCGIDVLTSGNHIWQKKRMAEYIDSNPYIVRPANYPAGTPGRGYTIYDSFGLRVLVMNVLGTTFMEPLSSPFDAIDEILGETKGTYDVSVLDIHAEATAEKLALANYFDGRINVIFGTHTHVQTADTRIFPNGTGYLTDLGMCGCVNSVLGVSVDKVIQKFRTRMPVQFENPSGDTEMNGAIFTLEKGKTASVELIRKLIY